MASKEDIRNRVDDIQRRAADSLITNLIVRFGGATAGPALIQAAQDFRGFAEELEAIKADLDRAPFTMPDPVVTVAHTDEGTVLTIPYGAFADDGNGEVDQEPGQHPGLPH
jgi:hypothetical protein